MKKTFENFSKIFKKRNKLFYSANSNVNEISQMSDWFRKNIAINNSTKYVREIDQWFWYWFKKISLKKRYFKWMSKDSSFGDSNAYLFYRCTFRRLNTKTDFHAFCFFFHSMFTHSAKLFELDDIEEIYLTDNPDTIVKLKDGSIFFIEFCLTNKNGKFGDAKWNIKKHIGSSKIRRSLRHRCHGKWRANNKFYILWIETKKYPNGKAYSLLKHKEYPKIKQYIETEAKPKFIHNTKRFKRWKFCFKYI